MFEQERFSYDPARSARAEEFREGHEQMDRQEEQIAHELQTIFPANLHKTAPRRRFMPNLPIRPYRSKVYGKHATHDIFVDFDAKSVIDLLGDADTTELWIAALHLDDGRDENVEGPFGPGFRFRWESGEQQTLISMDQRPVEFREIQGRGSRSCQSAEKQRAGYYHRSLLHGILRQAK
jgi:hypothetical protein